ncbi:MAG: phosphate/phosphite/phosphonate ABC transporter substrate-binding protein [Leisingera sp.]
MNIKYPLLLAGLCISLLFGHAAAARMLVVGTISDEPVKETRTFLPFAEYLADQLAGQGVTKGEVRIARDIAHMAELLRSGAVDIYVDSPLVSLAVRAECGSRLVARRWKKGVAQYHSVLFARRDSGIRTLEDLKGRVVAFEEAFSSSGYILPRLAVSGRAVPLAAMPGPRAERPQESTGYVFSGDDENTVEWVLRGLVDAGAMSLAGLKKRAGADFDDLEIILETEAIPRHVASVAPGMDEPFTAAVQAALTSMEQSPEGRSVLQAFERTTKFDAIPDRTREMLDQFQGPVSDLIGSN